MRSVIGSLSYLMTASFLVQTANAAITTIIAIVIALRGGTQADVSLVAGCYSLGFVIGCFIVPRYAVQVGLIRAYSAAAAILTISIIGIELFDGIAEWAILRLAMGASVAAVMAISDGWINDRTPGDARGRVIAIYSIVLGLGSVVSQLVLVWISAETEGLILVIAIVMNLSVVLVALSTSDAPTVAKRPSTKFRLVTITSVTAVVAAFASGFITVSLITITPYYLTDHGVGAELVALMMFSIFLGRLLSLWPIGILSDRVDRRLVIGGLSVVVVVFMGVGALALSMGTGEGKVVSGDLGLPAQLFGFAYAVSLGAAIYPIYSVASSRAFDLAGEESTIDVSGTLLVVNAIGSIAGPFSIMFLTGYLGDLTLFVAILVVSLGVLITVFIRRSLLEPSPDNSPIEIVPMSSLEMAQAVAEISEEQTVDSNNSAQTDTDKP